MLLENESETLVTKYIHLPFVRKVMEQDMEMLKKTELKFRDPYLILVEKTILKVGIDLGYVKKELSKKGIRIYNQGLKEGLCTYLIVTNGYHRERTFFPHLLRQNVESLVCQYLNSYEERAQS
jgi:hypothetical protein